ncbi:hypothetical protein CRH09_19475 [Nocardia terpenica]|uniref:Uncharacterized protein n=1 Tax=Nocardia terpenica TaxID=455432 RepID=A0A291RKB2_9NOCA|nr:hypothetical protein CRH09_19475 [Nocardia terpenica]
MLAGDGGIQVPDRITTKECEMDPELFNVLLETGSSALKGAVELGAAGVELATRILELVLAAV